MLFSQPWMLLGLGLCAVPVLIHLLSRRTYRREPWAAMRFLRAALERQARQLRLESLLLLLLRTLLIALVVLATAGPSFMASDPSFVTRDPIRRILVLDLSASLGRRADGERLIDRARREVQRCLDEAIVGDTFQLVRIAATSPRTIIRRESFDPQEVRQELEHWELTEERGDVLGSLTAVLDLLRTTTASPPPEVLVISDWQQSTWQPESAAARVAIQQALARIAERSRLRCIPVGGGWAGNLSVEGLRAARPLATPDHSVEVTALIRNHGRATVSTRLEWWVNGVMVDNALCEAAGEAATPVQRSVAAGGSDVLDIEVRLTADDVFPADNRRYLTIPVRTGLRVLLVEGRPAVRPIDGAAGYLATALAPLGSSQPVPGRLPLSIETINETALTERDLSDLDCLWLCDVARLEPELQLRLEQFVLRGGGLVISVGEQTLPADWNDWRNSAGETVLPVELSTAVDAPEEAGGAVTFTLGESPHAVVSPFVGNPDAGLVTTRIRRWMSATLREGAEPVLLFSHGAPAIVSRSFGLGRLAVVLTSVDRRWGSWAVWPSFPPLVRELTVFAAVGAEHRRTLVVGEPFERRLLPSQGRVDATVIDPQGRRATVVPRCTAEACVLRYETTHTAGVYRLECGPPANLLESLAVNLDPVESLTATLDEAQLARDLLPKQRFTFGTEEVIGTRGISGAATRGSLAGVLLFAALALLFVEQLLASRPRWGWAALVVACVAAGVWQAARISPGSALAVLLLAASAVVILQIRQQSPRRSRGRLPS